MKLVSYQEMAEVSGGDNPRLREIRRSAIQALVDARDDLIAMGAPIPDMIIRGIQVHSAAFREDYGIPPGRDIGVSSGIGGNF